MGVVLFDWKTSSTAKKVVNASLLSDCLFDGYLTERNYSPIFAGNSLFDYPTTIANQIRFNLLIINTLFI